MVARKWCCHQVEGKSATSHICSLHRSRLALAAGNAADSLEYLVKYEDKLNKIYKYFEFSLKNIQKVLHIAGIVQSSRGRRFQQVFATRWLSFDGSLTALISNYPALVALLMEESTKAPKAKGLLKHVASFKFTYVTHCLADIMAQLAHLCKIFQKKNLDFSIVFKVCDKHHEFLSPILAHS